MEILVREMRDELARAEGELARGPVPGQRRKGHGCDGEMLGYAVQAHRHLKETVSVQTRISRLYYAQEKFYTRMVELERYLAKYEEIELSEPEGQGEAGTVAREPA